MRGAVVRRIFAIGLMLSRIVLADVIHLPASQASTQGTGEMTMMAGMPCREHDGKAVDPAGQPPSKQHHVPTDDESCCKPSQCLCLHAPALMPGLQIPAVSYVSYSNVVPLPVQRASWRATVFFRPPI